MFESVLDEHEQAKLLGFDYPTSTSMYLPTRQEVVRAKEKYDSSARKPDPNVESE